MKKNISIFLALLIAVVAIGAGYFFATQKNNISVPLQTTDQTVDWKTYTNTKYGYIIKYPGTLTPIETPDDVIYLHHVEFKDTKATSISGITVEVRNLTSFEDEITYRKWQVEGHLIPGKIDSEEPVTVSGFPGTILSYTSGEEKFSIAIVPYQKFVYTITAQSNQLQLYNQLLSTFKFLNTVDTSSWKTHTAADKTFSFKFPAQWVVQPNQVFGSRSVTEFRFQNNPLFTVTMLGNYNQITGQPFKTLEEYLEARSTKSKDFLLDSIRAKRITDPGEAGHVLPYEEVVAFSKDSKFIISLFFEPDYYPQAKESKTFDQILSTFKFN